MTGLSIVMLFEKYTFFMTCMVDGAPMPNPHPWVCFYLHRKCSWIDQGWFLHHSHADCPRDTPISIRADWSRLLVRLESAIPSARILYPLLHRRTSLNARTYVRTGLSARHPPLTTAGGNTRSPSPQKPACRSP